MVLLHTTCRLLALLGGVLLLVVCLLIGASVLGRWLWAMPVAGDVELTQMLGASAIACALPWAQLAGGHIVVDAFTQRADVAVKRRLDALAALLLALLSALLCWRSLAGVLASKASGESSMILALPLWWAQTPMPVAFALLALAALGRLASQREGAR